MFLPEKGPRFYFDIPLCCTFCFAFSSKLKYLLKCHCTSMCVCVWSRKPLKKSYFGVLPFRECSKPLQTVGYRSLCVFHLEIDLETPVVLVWDKISFQQRTVMVCRITFCFSNKFAHRNPSGVNPFSAQGLHSHCTIF